VKKTVGSETRLFYFNKDWQCIEEYVGSTCDMRYVWGLRYVDDLVTYRNGSTDYYVLQDANWNVVALTNASGVVQERYTYSAFGKLNVFDASFTPKSASTYNLTRTFTGQVLDNETGLMLYRNRVYHPTLGRFLQRDPIGYFIIRYMENDILEEIEDINLFRYCTNNGVLFCDALGCSSLTACFKNITIFCSCFETCFIPADLGNYFTGKNKGKSIIKVIEKLGGTIMPGGGKGSHTKMILKGKTLIIPQSPAKGTAIALAKDIISAVCIGI
jgi:RHS repeat-associated protein